jgi:peptidoglycan hydrolase-like protein with peptidoglycan-binding domain
MRIALLMALTFMVALPARAGGPEFSSLHPESAYPDDLPRLTGPGVYDDYIAQVQRKLNALGFDAGPANGDFGSKTQTALGQFQIANLLPASGQLDDQTLKALGIARPQVGAADAAAGTTSDSDRSTSGN